MPLFKPFDPEGSGYDEEAGARLKKRYPLTIPRPSQYQGDYVTQPNAFEAWVYHNDLLQGIDAIQGGYVRHGSSLDPATGMVLKGRKHPSYYLTEQEEERRGSEIIKKNGRYYAVPKKGLLSPETKGLLNLHP